MRPTGPPRAPADPWSFLATAAPESALSRELLGGRYDHVRGAQNVALSRDVLVVANYEASVEVYERRAGGWVKTSTMTSELDGFGSSVATAGRWIVVGAYNSGVALAYRREPDGAWELKQKLAGSGTGSHGFFGETVRMRGQHLVVGAPSTLDDTETPDDTPKYPGAVYVFEMRGEEWKETERFVAPEGDIHFGKYLAVDGELLAITSIASSFSLHRPGRAYAFRRDAASGRWSREAELSPPDSAAKTGSYGDGVAVAGRTVFAGDRYGRGIHVFYRGGAAWRHLGALAPSRDEQRFERLLWAEPGVFLAGASGPKRLGVVEVFLPNADGTGWSRARTLAPPADKRPTSYFAKTSIATSNGLIVVAAPAGSHGVYLFTRTAPAP